MECWRSMIHGITVQLLTKTQSGVDAFNRPIYTEQAIDVDDVLVSPLSETEALEVVNLTGRKAVYQLCLPKGDAHDWTDKTVRFFGADWHTVGEPIEWIEDMVPLRWNKKVRVEHYNGG